MNSAAALQKVLIVIVMFAVLWIGGLLLVFGCMWRKKFEDKDLEMRKGEREKRRRGAQLSQSPHAVREYLREYVSAIFPSTFSNKPRFQRIWEEVMKHHSYLVLFSKAGGDYGNHRVLAGIQMLTLQTMLMFLLAVFYDLQAPDDDGTCQAHIAQVTCIARKSFLDHKKSYCQWSDNSPTHHTCSYQQPTFSYLDQAYIAVLVAIVTAIVNAPIDSLFRLLAAPIADAVKVSAADTVLKRAGRRMSDAARRVSIVAADAAVTAQALASRLTRKRLTVVGDVTREIPESTKGAKLLAVASLSVISSTANAIFAANASKRSSVKSKLQGTRASYYGEGQDDEASEDDKSDYVESDNEEDEADSQSDSDNSHSSDKANAVRGPSDAVVTTANADVLFASLKEEIMHQRRLLKPSETEEYDDQWGLDPTGEFVRRDRVSTFFQGKISAEAMIREEIITVQKEASAKIEKLKYAEDDHTGLEILHLFVLDVLGRETASARIFESKADEDFKSTQVVTRKTKALAWFGLFCTNAFFVYYCMLHGYQKGISWQRSYLGGCITQFLVEIFIFSTMECIWVNFFVPNLVKGDVMAVVKSLTDTIDQLCKLSHAQDSRMFLDVPNYLFVSTKVAQNFPNLLESVIVRTYESHLPGQLAKKWQFGPVACFSRSHNVKKFTLVSVLFTALQTFGASPYTLQRVFIRLTQPWLLTGLTMVFYYAIENPVTIAMTSLAVAIVISLIYRNHLNDKRNHAKTSIVQPDFGPDYDDSVDDDDSDSVGAVGQTPSNTIIIAPMNAGSTQKKNKKVEVVEQEDLFEKEEEKDSYIRAGSFSQLSASLSKQDAVQRTVAGDEGSKPSSAVSFTVSFSNNNLPLASVGRRQTSGEPTSGLPLDGSYSSNDDSSDDSDSISLQLGTYDDEENNSSLASSDQSLSLSIGSSL